MNLRGEAARLAEDLDPEVLVHDDDCYTDAGELIIDPKAIRESAGHNKGWRRLVRLFGQSFPEGKLRELPRVYKDFFLKCRLQGGADSAMDRYLNEIKRAKAALERADEDTSISDGILGFFVLQNSGLSEKEVAHVLGLSGNTYLFPKLEPHLRDLYPTGTLERGNNRYGGGGGFQNRHRGRAYIAEGGEEYYLEGGDVDPEGYTEPWHGVDADQYALEEATAFYGVEGNYGEEATWEDPDEYGEPTLE